MLNYIVFFHCAILTISITIFFFIANQLRIKLLHYENLTVLIQLDLSFLNVIFVFSISLIVLVREIHGQFESLAAASYAYFVINTLFHAMLLFKLSLQSAQVTYILNPSLLNRINLKYQNYICKCFVVVTSVVISYFVGERQTLICSSGAWT